MTFRGEFSVTVRTTTTTGDQYGDSTTTVVERTVDRVLYAPRSSQERTDNRTPTVYVAGAFYFLAGLPAEVTLDSDDAIVVAGVHPLVDGTYQVEGIPGYWNGQVEVAVNRTGGV